MAIAIAKIGKNGKRTFGKWDNGNRSSWNATVVPVCTGSGDFVVGPIPCQAACQVLGPCVAPRSPRTQQMFSAKRTPQDVPQREPSCDLILRELYCWVNSMGPYTAWMSGSQFSHATSALDSSIVCAMCAICIVELFRNGFLVATSSIFALLLKSKDIKRCYVVSTRLSRCNSISLSVSHGPEGWSRDWGSLAVEWWSKDIIGGFEMSQSRQLGHCWPRLIHIAVTIFPRLAALHSTSELGWHTSTTGDLPNVNKSENRRLSRLQAALAACYAVQVACECWPGLPKGQRGWKRVQMRNSVRNPKMPGTKRISHMTPSRQRWRRWWL